MTQPSQSSQRSSSSGTTVQDIAEKTKDKIGNASQRLEDMAETASQKGREVSENMQQVSANFRTAAEKSLREQPYTTLALTAAVAFVLGAMWRS